MIFIYSDLVYRYGEKGLYAYGHDFGHMYFWAFLGKALVFCILVLIAVKLVRKIKAYIKKLKHVLESIDYRACQIEEHLERLENNSGKVSGDDASAENTIE